MLKKTNNLLLKTLFLFWEWKSLWRLLYFVLLLKISSFLKQSQQIWFSWWVYLSLNVTWLLHFLLKREIYILNILGFLVHKHMQSSWQGFFILRNSMCAVLGFCIIKLKALRLTFHCCSPSVPPCLVGTCAFSSPWSVTCFWQAQRSFKVCLKMEFDDENILNKAIFENHP